MSIQIECLTHYARYAVRKIIGLHNEAAHELHLAETLAYSAGYYENITGCIVVEENLPEELQESYRFGLECYERSALQQITQRAYKALLFCPNGHNVVESYHSSDECAACGAIMTANAEEDFLRCPNPGRSVYVMLESTPP